jgi:hypothetical protein
VAPVAPAWPGPTLRASVRPCRPSARRPGRPALATDADADADAAQRYSQPCSSAARTASARLRAPVLAMAADR